MEINEINKGEYEYEQELLKDKRKAYSYRECVTVEDIALKVEHERIRANVGINALVKGVDITRQTYSNFINLKNAIRINKLVLILRALGFKIVIERLTVDEKEYLNKNLDKE